MKLEESGLSILPGRYADDMIEAFEAKYGMVRAQKVPAGPEIQEADRTSLLSYEEATFFRSLVGSGIYLSLASR